MSVVRLTPAAADDIRSAAAWYERRNVSARSKLIATIDRAVEQIARHPLAFPAATAGTHRAVLFGFPFQLFFRIEDDDVVVLACLHAARDPAALRAVLAERH